MFQNVIEPKIILPNNSNGVQLRNQSIQTYENERKQKEKAKRIKKNLNEILVNSTSHGIPNIIRANSLFLKIMWSLFFILSTCTCFFYIAKIITEFLKFNTVTTISFINERQSLFPTVSFCSWPVFNESIDKIVLSVTFEKVKLENYGEIFEPFNDSTYGQCFRFNSGKNMNGKKVVQLKSTKGGFTNRLNIQFYLNTPSTHDYSELLVNIHNESLLPYSMSNEGYWLKPGSLNNFQIERVFTERLDEPYSDCIKDINRFNLNKTLVNFMRDSERIYTQTDCFYLCSYLFAIKENNCSCHSDLTHFENDCVKQFNNHNKTMINCVNNYLKEFRDKFQYDKCPAYCPLECDSMSYSIIPYFESYPGHGNISNYSKKDNSLERFQTYEEVNKHLIVLTVYYKRLHYSLINQVPQTETFGFVSNIGGILGLFLGVSFLSFIEIIEVLAEIFNYFIN